jgi:predicted RNA-binding Zn ribbon-like protein
VSATSASDRFGVTPVPDDLLLTHELINTVGFPAQSVPDLLAGPAVARRWLDPVLATWCEQHGATSPPLSLTEADLGRLRTLRSGLRDLTAGRPATLDSAVAVHAGPDGVRAIPRGKGTAWLESAVAAELLLAQERDQLRRLKLCRNDKCGLAFYDLSKNNSRIWHDLAHCGTPMHVREYRKRLRAAAVEKAERTR